MFCLNNMQPATVTDVHVGHARDQCTVCYCVSLLTAYYSISVVTNDNMNMIIVAILPLNPSA
jgi:hypothetical protein